MGTFDISRINFNKAKHYSSVRMQQGRVLSDDDWNEAARIEEEIRRQSDTEIIGSFGSPDNGFKIDNLTVVAGKINFDISPGTLYLGGLRLELESPETYRLQKDWLQQPPLSAVTPVIDNKERYDLAYLETWQQAVSAVEDSSLFEAALGGPDTTTRLKIMRRIHLATGTGFESCADNWAKLVSDWHSGNAGKINKGYERVPDTLLKVTFTKSGQSKDLCTPSAAGGYLGAENQAIRVQLVDKDHFTWGFDNAAPLYRVTISADGKTITMLTLPKDQYHWPLSNQVVEILPWSAVLPNGEKVAEMSGYLTRVESSFDPDSGEFTLADAVIPGFGTEWKSRTDKDDLDNQDPGEYFYLRVWNRGDDISSDPEIKITPGLPQTLGHTGLEITITGNDRVADDFWVIAARPETPDRVVPWEFEKGLPPHGVRRFFAPLAVIKWTKNGNLLKGEVIHDCRKRFHPLTELSGCCTFTVGDGKHSIGDFNSIQEAVDNLPEAGGKICVLCGEHIGNVTISQKRQIRISGCGPHSIVRPDRDSITKPVFMILNSQSIEIDQLTIVTFDGTGIEVTDRDDSALSSDQITIKDNSILAGIHAINIHVKEDKGGDNNINITNNNIGMVDKAIGKAAVFSIADAVLIERNRIVVIPAYDTSDPDDPRSPGGGDLFEPCFDLNKTYLPEYSILFQVYTFIRYILLYRPTGRSLKKYLTWGGIQIGGTSERVRIIGNEITGGKGNGITLGHSGDDQVTPVEVTDNPDVNFLHSAKFVVNDTKYSYSALYDITIEGNRIRQMGLSGISTLINFKGDEHIVITADITISCNTVHYCARQIPAEIPVNFRDKWAFGGIILSNSESGKIQNNRVENNGLITGLPVCGIFISYGEKNVISTNIIVNNGRAVTNDEADVKPGNRGGIVVKMSFAAADLLDRAGLTKPSFDGVPAVVVQDNVVLQPCGFALLLFAFGPVSVVSNQFTSLGTDKTNALSLLASSVFIFNLGVSKDILLISFRNMMRTMKPSKENPQLDPNLLPLLEALQFLPNGKVMFVANQTTLDMRSPLKNLCLSSQLIASLDDIAFNSNQAECAGLLSATASGITFDFVLINTILFGATVRSNDNRLTDGMTLTIYSLASSGYLNTATGNQSTHCLLVSGTKKAVNDNLVLFNSSCKDQ